MRKTLLIAGLFLISLKSVAQIYGGTEVNLGKKYSLLDSVSWKLDKQQFNFLISAKKDALWSSNVIDVCWENPSNANKEGRKWVKEAVEGTWGVAGNLSFTGWKGCTPANVGVRIQIKDDHPHCKGLGKDLRGMLYGTQF
jgi:hypothetical protein